MMWQPIFSPLWLLVLLFALPFGFAVWRTMAEWHTPRRWIWAQRGIIVLLVFVISLRPSIPGASRTSGSASLDVYFVVDSSLSSTAEDYNGKNPRLDGMRQDAKDIAMTLAGARFSVISFGNSSRTVLPLTTDTSALSTAVDTIIPDSPLYATGSAIDQAIDEMQASLTQSKTKSPGRGRIVFYMGDGEQTAKSAVKSFASLAPLVNGGGILGYGTYAGGRMQELTYDGKPSAIYVKDHSQDSIPDAVSTIDEAALQNIASQLQLRYIHRTQPGAVDKLSATINIQKVLQSSHDYQVLNDLYWVLAVPVTLLIAYNTRFIYLQARQLRQLYNRRLL